MKSTILFLFAGLLFHTNLFGQGFNTFNARNHPHLNWQVAETEHFKIIYPERIAGIETEAAAIAEESYKALSKNLEIAPEKKIRIYLSDEDEINNGFASPIGKGYTNIWVNLNDYAETWTGREKWLRKVIAHELAHIFHFHSVWTGLGLAQRIFADPLPLFWAEGLAQYQTETWDSQRGDRWLRKAIFDSRPSFRDGQSAENGRLMYASGNAQLRYFTETRGDSTLIRLLASRKKVLGLLPVHDFDHAFREVTGDGYEAFFEEWRKHMNIYYNTLASLMERTDSLGRDPLDLPGQFYFDMAASPDDSLLAVLSLTSLERPVRRLHMVRNDSSQSGRMLAEGAINPDLSWSRNGSAIYYSRRVRGEHSSLLNDIFLLDIETGNERRITKSRRARYPAAGPGEDEIGYIVNENGTGTLFVYNLKTGTETRITRYTGDVQLLWPVWIKTQKSWLVYRFDEAGNRHLVLIRPETGNEKILDEGSVDNRKPVLSPDESKIAFTSLRDEVPNVFVYDFGTGAERRMTNLFTGGEVYAWTGRADTLRGEHLLIRAGETKKRDHAYWLAAAREPVSGSGSAPEAYGSWRKKSPQISIPSGIEPDENQIRSRYDYSSFRNITHGVSLPLPWYAGREQWGPAGLTSWAEPLAKHMIFGAGTFSVPTPENSMGILSYINNQLYPTLAASVYKIPGTAFFYGNRFLAEELTGGEVSMLLPLDVFEKAYQTGSIFARIRHVKIRPYEADRFPDTIPAPLGGRQTDLLLGWGIQKQRPWSNNNIHPLDGYGIRVLMNGAEKVAGSDVRFLRGDVSAYTILPGPGLQRFYLHGRYQIQYGEPLPQDYIGFPETDNIHLQMPGELPVSLFNEADRVRGYRRFVAGRRVAFGSIEYRMPFLSSLKTTILGLVELRSASLALFSDAGVTWEAGFAGGTSATEKRWGAGAEIKNEVNLFGINITHALGIAQPAQKLFTDAGTDFYYRIRAAVPF